MKNTVKTVIIFIFVPLVLLAMVVYTKKSTPHQPVSTNDVPVQNTIQPFTPSNGETPDIPFMLSSGYVIHIFADGLVSPRDLEFSPGGTLLVSSLVTRSVYVLPDKNSDGAADSVKTAITSENHPHGLAFYQDKPYIADTEQVVRYFWDEEALSVVRDRSLFDLPPNGNHNNRTITFDQAGKMYVSVGSTCNVCHEASELSATVVVSDFDGKNPTVFATGLRNAAFIQFNPATHELWGTEMGRDRLGDNLPPDEINIIRQGINYGWPDCYGNKIPDTSFNPNPICDDSAAPVYEIPAHSAPLGFVFIDSTQFPGDWQGDILVAYHGSWNRSVPTGYKVVHLEVNGNDVSAPVDFLSGFIPVDALSGDEAQGRPADLIFDRQGNLYLSDDKSGKVYIIQKK